MHDERTTASELRERWPLLSPEERIEGFERLDRDEAEGFFLSLSPRGKAMVIGGCPAGERRIWMRLIAPDDAADVVQEFPPTDREGLLDLLDKTARNEVRALLAYAEDEAGGLMSPRFARIRPDMTAEEASRYVRRQVRDQPETIYYVYVLDGEQHILGIISFRELLTAPGDRLVREIMKSEVITVPEDMDDEEVARVIARHDFLAVPVVDQDGRMKGIVTVDDIVDVVQREATEDIHKLGGLEALDIPYMQTGFLPMLRKRAGWLALLFVGEMLTTNAMARYEDEIARALVLAIFIPLIISSGGNSGSQAATLVTRALALGEVRPRNWWRIARREIAMGLSLGGVLAVVGLLRVVLGEWLFQSFGEHAFLLGLTVGLSLIGVVLWGTVCGSMLPLILRALRLDPASASAPFVATLVDVSGLLIYFTVAEAILSGTLL